MNKNKMNVWLVLFSLIMLTTACKGGDTTTAAIKPTTVAAQIPGTMETTTTSKIPETTITTTQTTTTTKTSVVPTPPSPTDLAKNGFASPEIPRVSCEQLKVMIEGSSNFALIDTRAKTSFTLGYLPGATNIPLDSFTPDAVNQQLTMIPANKMAIFYCDCPDDKESADMANNLILLRSGDISNVRILWKGYYRWLELGYPITKK